MSFEVHPGMGSAPLLVAAGASSAELAFSELAAVDPVLGRNTMYVRVVQVDEGDGRAAPAPSIRLAAGQGPLTDVGAAATLIPAQVGVQPAGNATLTAGSGGLYLVEVEVLATQPAPWRIQLRNNDSVSRRYVWVVGSSAVASNRPWLDVLPGGLTFRAAAGAPQQVTIANYGPGPLTVGDADGADLGLGFRLVDVTPRPIGGNRRGVARIDSTIPAAGARATTHDFSSNDPGATATAGHNNRLSLIATGAGLWHTGDILAISGRELCRLDKASQQLVPVVSDVAGAIDVAVDPSTGDAVVIGAGFAMRVDRFTGVATPLPGFAGFTEPVGVAVVHDGTILLVDNRVGEVVSVAPGGEPASQTANPPFDQPRDVAVDADGNVVVCGGPDGQGKVMRGDPRDGTTAVVASSGTLSVQGGVVGPLGIAIEPDGTILTMRPYKRTVQGVPFDNGDLIRVVGNTTRLIGSFSRLADPAALDVAPDGTVVVAARGGVFAVDTATRAITQLSSEMVGRLAVVPSLSPEKIVGQSN